MIGGRRRIWILQSRPIRQGPVDVDSLGAIDIDNPDIARVLGHGAIEKIPVEGAVVVVVASALGILLAKTDHRQRLVLLRCVVRIVVVVAVGVCVGPVQPDPREESQRTDGQEKRENSSWRPAARSVGGSSAPRVGRPARVRWLSA